MGELTKAVLQYTWEPAKGVTKADIRAEAMALRFLSSIDRYGYARGTEHVQEQKDRLYLDGWAASEQDDDNG